jgi:hypothetical protein
MRCRYLLALVVVLAAACSDDITTVPAPANPAPGDAVIFDQVKHLVLEPVRSDVHETISVLAHVCPPKASGCPDGTEEIVPMASHHIIPGQLYMSHPEVFLEPPEACRVEGARCYLSVAHCEFDSRSDQAAGGACVPAADSVGAAAAGRREGDPGACVRKEAAHSHHIDHSCLRDGAS